MSHRGTYTRTCDVLDIGHNIFFVSIVCTSLLLLSFYLFRIIQSISFLVFIIERKLYFFV
jgi:hypothetical protein